MIPGFLLVVRCPKPGVPESGQLSEYRTTFQRKRLCTIEVALVGCRCAGKPDGGPLWRTNRGDSSIRSAAPPPCGFRHESHRAWTVSCVARQVQQYIKKSTTSTELDSYGASKTSMVGSGAQHSAQMFLLVPVAPSPQENGELKDHVQVFELYT